MAIEITGAVSSSTEGRLGTSHTTESSMLSAESSESCRDPLKSSENERVDRREARAGLTALPTPIRGYGGRTRGMLLGEGGTGFGPLAVDLREEERLPLRWLEGLGREAGCGDGALKADL